MHFHKPGFLSTLPTIIIHVLSRKMDALITTDNNPSAKCADSKQGDCAGAKLTNSEEYG